MSNSRISQDVEACLKFPNSCCSVCFENEVDGTVTHVGERCTVRFENEVDGTVTTVGEQCTVHFENECEVTNQSGEKKHLWLIGQKPRGELKDGEFDVEAPN
ncbi:hypothetical protein [Pteropox virus]|uniref:Uncharacterized protein n=1 Tax=Pteropox virus TaxID=1873698 RepID=A0A1B1MR94_9POXV|nr:hypothetical protein [Pteropox virus]ANS71097.1 hypothetical protein [Pteropox virus]